jgi:DNA modification methylase
MAQHIEEKSVNVAVASPPYNIGATYDSYKDDLSTEECLKWIESVGIEIKSVKG